MNSTQLQEEFPNIYKDFFARNDLVMSGCFSFSWTPSWVWERSNFIRIKSKIPLKCYVWIKKRKDSNIFIKDVINYDVIKKSFEKIPFVKINSEEKGIIDLIKSLSESTWYEIEILSEISRWHSFGFSGTLWALISYWINQFLWKYSDEEIFINWWKIDHISRFANSGWENVIKTLENNSWISYYLTEEFDKTFPVSDLGNLKYKFENLWNDLENIMPVDYFMIFSWIPTDTKQAEYYKLADSREFEKIDEFISNKIESDLLKKSHFSMFTKKNSIFETLADSISILNIRTLQILDEIISSWYKEEIIEKLIDNINNYRSTISILENQSNFAESFIYNFQKNKSNPDEKIWIMPWYYWKLWWWYAVVMKRWISRDTIEKTLQDMKQIYPSVEIEYCSYLDGEASDGVIIEQYISQWIYSQYVDKNKFLFQSNKWDNYIGDYSEIIEKEQNGLLFDMINNKIYLNGEKLTSKDIPSQNTTIEVVTRLLEHIGEELSNKELPSSSYASNKNEMLGKIILPLIKLIEDRTKEQLPLTCKWGLNDFYIKMWDVNIKIGAIKRM